MENLTEEDFNKMQQAIIESLTTGESKFTTKDGGEIVVNNDYVKEINKQRKDYVKYLKQQLKELNKLSDTETVGISTRQLKSLIEINIEYFETRY